MVLRRYAIRYITIPDSFIKEEGENGGRRPRGDCEGYSELKDENRFLNEKLQQIMSNDE